MTTHLFRRLATATLLAAGFAAAPAGAAAISSTVAEDGTTQSFKHPQHGTIGTFGFSNPAASLSDIAELVLTLTLEDGDSAPGNFDHGDLSLALDGIDTGLLLDGYTGGQTVTQSLHLGTLGSVAAPLYAELIDDGELEATMLDADGDQVAGARDHTNGKNFMSLPSGYLAALTLIGSAAPAQVSGTIPEPSSLALGVVGLAGLTLSRRRRPN